MPTLPTGWSSGGISSVVKKVSAPVKDAKTEKKKKPRHKLPKGAASGKPFTEDVGIAQISIIIINGLCADIDSRIDGCQ